MNEDELIRDEDNLVLHRLEGKKKALLVSAYQSHTQKSVCQEHLEELELLCETFGITAVAKIPCHVRKFDASIFVGKGKLEELVGLSNELGADLIIFDDEISPAQQRNLEKAFEKSVIDRTEVILGVFAERAETKEAKLQIKLAQVRYEAPRLKRLWTHLSRQHGTAGSGGGGGYLKGEGEKQIEIDRRILKRKIDLLEDELKEVKANRETLRSARIKSEIPVFAIVGYTNAGKSTLLNALTDAGVLVEDKLFATLDTTTRKFSLKNNQEVLLVDTVGFIRKLPHLLVAAFKSTLEEAIEADVLIHLIDASHPMALEQAEATKQVLKELNASEKDIITVLNKMDKVEHPSIVHQLRMTFPKNVQISALKKHGFDELEQMMQEELSARLKRLTLRVPQSNYAIVSDLIRFGNIISQEYDENDILLTVELPSSLAGKYLNYQVID